MPAASGVKKKHAIRVEEADLRKKNDPNRVNDSGRVINSGSCLFLFSKRTVPQLLIRFVAETNVLVILRKEVIQPQVPLRLPCYDLVPIAEFIFGACLPEGLAWRLRMPPTFVA